MNTNYSNISIITPEQGIFKSKSGFMNHVDATDFARDSKKWLQSIWEREYGIDHVNRVWIKNDISLFSNKEEKTIGLCMENGNMNEEFIFEETSKIYGIIPTIPCKHILSIANKISDNCYEFGYFPHDELDLSFFKEHQLEPEKAFKPTNEKYSFPCIEDNKILTKTYTVYEFNGIKAIKYKDNTWYAVEPVKWEKQGDYFISSKILFQFPMHIGKINNKSLSFDNSLLKLYLDKYFAKELVQRTDYTFSNELLLNLDDEIKFKTAELKRLQQIRGYVIKNINNEKLENTLSEQDINSKKL